MAYLVTHLESGTKSVRVCASDWLKWSSGTEAIRNEVSPWIPDGYRVGAHYRDVITGEEVFKLISVPEGAQEASVPPLGAAADADNVYTADALDPGPIKLPDCHARVGTVAYANTPSLPGAEEQEVDQYAALVEDIIEDIQEALNSTKYLNCKSELNLTLLDLERKLLQARYRKAELDQRQT